MVASTALGWYFRQQQRDGVGLDGYFEVLADGVPSGRLLGVQLKAGSSYFTRPTETGDGWVYYDGSQKLRDYWLNYQLPVLLVLYDPDTNTAYWQHITPETAQVIGKGFKVIVPSSQRLDASSKLALTAIADQALAHKDTRPASVLDNATSVQGAPACPEVRNELAGAWARDVVQARAIEEVSVRPAVLNGAVAEAIHNLIQAGTIQGGVHVHGVGVRPGQPGLEARFQAAFDLAGGAARLGSAMGEVQQDGPGWVQAFDGGPTGQPAVLCALPRKAAVAVAVQV